MGVEVAVIGAEWCHAEHVAHHMRPEDVAELWSAYRHAPAEGVRQSLLHSVEAWAITVNDLPVALWGVAPLSVLLGKGSPWMLATPDVYRYRKSLFPVSFSVVDYMLSVFPHLENHVDARNRSTLAWLRRLGFEIQPASPFGFDRLPFHRIHMSREVAQCVNQ